MTQPAAVTVCEGDGHVQIISSDHQSDLPVAGHQADLWGTISQPYTVQTMTLLITGVTVENWKPINTAL
jgi:hypothetical protein